MMHLTDLWGKSILILGYGVEGVGTFQFLRELFHDHRIGIADKRRISELDEEAAKLLTAPSRIKLSYNFGPDYLSSSGYYDVIFKSPGIRSDLPELRAARARGAAITSHTELFLRCSRSKTIGVTGTKGKGTTAKLIHTILDQAGYSVRLVGNIGRPPLPLLKGASSETLFVFEISSQQLEGTSVSPHVAVCLKVVPDHLDFHNGFSNYLEAKSQVTLHQSDADYFVYDADNDLLAGMANSTRAIQLCASRTRYDNSACYVENGNIFVSEKPDHEFSPIISVEEALKNLPGLFNLSNILPAIAVAKSYGVDNQDVVAGLRAFESLPNRFENVGTFRGIIFYNASISTVPEVTIEHIKALGEKVQTILLGGFDRGIEFSKLGDAIRNSKIENVILFPATGKRIWHEVEAAFSRRPGRELPARFVIQASNGEEAMNEAVTYAFEHTNAGRICLHSPASPSFGLFRDFHQRGRLFKENVLALSGSIDQ